MLSPVLAVHPFPSGVFAGCNSGPGHFGVFGFPRGLSLLTPSDGFVFPFCGVSGVAHKLVGRAIVEGARPWVVVPSFGEIIPRPKMLELQYFYALRA